MWSSRFLDCKDSAHCLIDSWDSTVQSNIVLDSFSLPIFGFALVFTMLGCLFSRHRGSHNSFQFSSCVFKNFKVFSVVYTNTNKFLSVLEHCRALVFLLRLPVFPDSQRLYQFFQTSGHTWSSLVVLWIFVNLPPDHIFPFGSFSVNRVNFVNPFQELDECLLESTFQ